MARRHTTLDARRDPSDAGAGAGRAHDGWQRRRRAFEAFGSARYEARSLVALLDTPGRTKTGRDSDDLLDQVVDHAGSAADQPSTPETRTITASTAAPNAEITARPRGAVVSGVDTGRFQSLLEGLALTGSEARTLVALLRLGSASIRQLSEVTGISRSNVYPVLDSLQALGAAQRLPGRFPVWSSPGADEVLAALRAAEKARSVAAEELFERRFEEARNGLAELPKSAERSAQVIVVDDDARSAAAYQEAMATVEGEILVFNRGPYVGDVEPAPPVLDSFGRGVRARAMYQTDELEDPALRHCADVYAQAGVDQRVVDDLPVSMAVLGEDLVLLSLPNDDPTAIDCHTATVRNRGMVRLVSAAFDHLWAQGRPYKSSEALTQGARS